MSKYTLYYNSLQEIIDYHDYEQAKKQAEIEKRVFNRNIPTTPKLVIFNVDNEACDKFDLEQIDRLTTQYKSEDHLLQELAKSKSYQYLFTDGVNKHLTLVYKYSGYKQTEIIYDNKLLSKCAAMIQKKKKNNQTPELEYFEELNEFIKRIKTYAKSETYRKKLKNSKYVDYYLKKDLVPYIKLFEQHPDFLTPSQASYRDELENAISRKMKNYQTVRNLILWEKKYIPKEVINKLQGINIVKEEPYQQQEFDIDDMMGFKDLEQEVLETYNIGGKELVLETYDEEFLVTLSNETLEKLELTTLKKDVFDRRTKEEKQQKKLSIQELKQYENDKIFIFFNEGGTSHVIEMIDLDELLTYPEEILASVGIDKKIIAPQNVDGLNGKIK